MRLFLAVLLIAACHSSHTTPAPIPPPSEPVAVAPPVDAAPDAALLPPKDIDSAEILARDPSTTEVEVRHVLVAWKELGPSYRGKLDPRAEERTNEAAAALALEIAATLAKDQTQLDAITKEHSEDPGSLDGAPYTVGPDSKFVPEFKALALRLHENEVGIVRTQFGYHVMVRMPPDPLLATAILARTPIEETVHVQIVLILWKGRVKAEADKLAVAALARVKKGEPIAKVMAEVSEDPGSKATGRVYDVEPKSGMDPALDKIAFRLKLGEVALAKGGLGWFVVKRVPPPPPDPLESANILKRKPVTDLAKVKHILLGWKDVHADDERGKTRTRPELEQLVKSTLAKLKAGGSFEALMKELSEDPGSASDGQSYDVNPTAAIVAPFIALSLRLKVGEIGVVKTAFGIHIIKRVE